jgi:hypothetical protein
MAEITVGSLIDLLQHSYKTDDVLVTTWWSKEDVAIIVEEEGWGSDLMSDDDFIEDVWNQVASRVDVAVEYGISDVNDELYGFVEKYVMRGER